MVEPYWWYVLFVRAGRENKVISELKTAFERKEVAFELDVFYPEAEQYYRSKKYHILGHRYLRRPLFPGYLFVETTMPEDTFLREFSDYVYHSPDIIRLLKDSGGQVALPDDERKRFEYLFRGKRCIEHSVGYIVGEKIVVEAGPLAGREGIIRRINRHNHDALIEFTLFGEQTSVKVALEVVSKT